jgi:hypothetical protein
MPSISLVLLSGRYLSFAEREEIAILKAQGAEPAWRWLALPPALVRLGASDQGSGP